MAITCPQCGSHFHVPRCSSSATASGAGAVEVAYPGTDQRAGHVDAQAELAVGRISKSVQLSGTDSEIRPTGLID